MQLEVLLFAAAKDAADRSSIVIEVSDSPSAREVMEAVGKVLPELRDLMRSCRLAVDCDYVAADAQVPADAKEIALIPPVSGG